MAYRITYFIQFSLLGVGLAASTGHLARLVPETHEILATVAFLLLATALISFLVVEQKYYLTAIYLFVLLMIGMGAILAWT